MSLFDDLSCGCGEPPHPDTTPLPAGLPALPMRQRAGFPEFRHAMLRAIPTQPALLGWRARGEQDLGVMLLESWAYVLDVTGFYDARTAERAFIQTAPDAAQAQRIVDLRGYQPRGAVSATVTLAIDLDGVDPVTVPARTGFRSDAFDGHPPQVFETDSDFTAWPQRDRWTLAPVREALFDGALRFGSRGAPAAGAVILVAAGSARAAARVLDVAPEPDRAGGTLQRLVLADGDAGVSALAGATLADMRVSQLRLALSPTGFGTAYTQSTGELVLDSLYPQLRAGQEAAIEIGGDFSPETIAAVAAGTVTIDQTTKAQMAVTTVTLSPAPAIPAGGQPVLHCVPVPLGKLQSLALASITLTDIAGGATLAPTVTALGDAPANGALLARGKGKLGAAFEGTIAFDATSQATLQPASSSDSFAAPLTAPVEILGNVVTAVQGQSVFDEVLGSGDASQPWQVYTLKKKPLAWREDGSQPGGRRPDLTVRVNGIEWLWVPTLFDQQPAAEVFTVRNLPDGNAEIRFGDGKRGARVPTGVGNVHADYRYGAGAATPPPGSIGQFVRKSKPFKAVYGPLPAQGGSDPETIGEMRTAAPRSALTLGRAVSIADFEALALSFSGIVNVTAGWSWDGTRQRALVRLWVIDSSGEPGDRLRDWLKGQAAPDVGVEVKPAEPADVTAFSVSLDIAERYDPATVRDAAFASLFGSGGLLAADVQRIGAPLFRSALTAALHAVPGIASVSEVLVNDQPMPAAIAPGEGCWFALAGLAIVR
jgi:hypothetical protein